MPDQDILLAALNRIEGKLDQFIEKNDKEHADIEYRLAACSRDATAAISQIKIILAIAIPSILAVGGFAAGKLI